MGLLHSWDATDRRGFVITRMATANERPFAFRHVGKLSRDHFHQGWESVGFLVYPGLTAGDQPSGQTALRVAPARDPHQPHVPERGRGVCTEGTEPCASEHVTETPSYGHQAEHNVRSGPRDRCDGMAEGFRVHDPNPVEFTTATQDLVEPRQLDSVGNGAAGRNDRSEEPRVVRGGNDFV